MKNNTQHIDDLLVKQLTGEATDAETQEVQQWLTQDKGNQHYYDHFRLIWEESVHLAASTEIDEQAAWTRFQQRSAQKASETAKARVWSMNHPLLRAAVISGVVLTIAMVTYFLFHNNPGHVVELATVSAIDSVKTEALPDGSEVVLNKQSQISYPNQFTGDRRPVQLNGEAFFQVKPNKEKPFTVSTNNVTITVVGTSFNVKSRGDTTEIIVETGIVKVATDQQTITLKAGERVSVFQNTQLLEKQTSNDHLHNYYRSKKFECDGTQLWRLVDKLNEVYHANIVIDNPELRNLPLSTTFDGQSLDDVLVVVQETLGFSITKEKGQIILR